LERLQRNDTDTYILKIRVLLNEILSECAATSSTLYDTTSKGQSAYNMGCYSKRQPVGAGPSVSERVQLEIMDSIAALSQCDNFHLGHLLVVMYEADQIRWQLKPSREESQSLAGQASQRVLQVLVDFVLSFI